MLTVSLRYVTKSANLLMRGLCDGHARVGRGPAGRLRTRDADEGRRFMATAKARIDAAQPRVNLLRGGRLVRSIGEYGKNADRHNDQEDMKKNEKLRPDPERF